MNFFYFGRLYYLVLLSLMCVSVCYADPPEIKVVRTLSELPTEIAKQYSFYFENDLLLSFEDQELTEKFYIEIEKLAKFLTLPKDGIKPIKIILLNNPEPNAGIFADRNNKLGTMVMVISSGLLDLIEGEESELAAAIGHEYEHITSIAGKKRLEERESIKPIMMINLQRLEENEVDIQSSIQRLHQKGIKPQAMVGLLKRLYSRYGDQLSLTHSTLSSRIDGGSLLLTSAERLKGEQLATGEPPTSSLLLYEESDSKKYLEKKRNAVLEKLLKEPLALDINVLLEMRNSESFEFTSMNDYYKKLLGKINMLDSYNSDSPDDQIRRRKMEYQILKDLHINALSFMGNNEARVFSEEEMFFLFNFLNLDLERFFGGTTGSTFVLESYGKYLEEEKMIKKSNGIDRENLRIKVEKAKKRYEFEKSFYQDAVIEPILKDFQLNEEGTAYTRVPTLYWVFHDKDGTRRQSLRDGLRDTFPYEFKSKKVEFTQLKTAEKSKAMQIVFFFEDQIINLLNDKMTEENQKELEEFNFEDIKEAITILSTSKNSIFQRIGILTKLSFLKTLPVEIEDPFIYQILKTDRTTAWTPLRIYNINIESMDRMKTFLGNITRESVGDDETYFKLIAKTLSSSSADHKVDLFNSVSELLFKEEGESLNAFTSLVNKDDFSAAEKKLKDVFGTDNPYLDNILHHYFLFRYYESKSPLYKTLLGSVLETKREVGDMRSFENELLEHVRWLSFFKNLVKNNNFKKNNGYFFHLRRELNKSIQEYFKDWIKSSKEKDKLISSFKFFGQKFTQNESFQADLGVLKNYSKNVEMLYSLLDRESDNEKVAFLETINFQILTNHFVKEKLLNELFSLKFNIDIKSKKIFYNSVVQSGIRDIAKESIEAILTSFPSMSIERDFYLRDLENILVFNYDEHNYLKPFLLSSENWVDSADITVGDVYYILKTLELSTGEAIQVCRYLNLDVKELSDSFFEKKFILYQSKTQFETHSIEDINNLKKFFERLKDIYTDSILIKRSLILQTLIGDNDFNTASKEQILYDYLFSSSGMDEIVQVLFQSYLSSIPEHQFKTIVTLILAEKGKVSSGSKGALLKTVLQAQGPLGVIVGQFIYSNGLVDAEMLDELENFLDDVNRPSREQILEDLAKAFGKKAYGFKMLGLYGSGSINYVVGVDVTLETGEVLEVVVRRRKRNISGLVENEKNIWLKAIEKLKALKRKEFDSIISIIEEALESALKNLAVDGIEMDHQRDIRLYSEVKVAYAREASANRFEIIVSQPVDLVNGWISEEEKSGTSVFYRYKAKTIKEIKDKKLRSQIAFQIAEKEMEVLAQGRFCPDGHKGNWLIVEENGKVKLVRIDYSEFQEVDQKNVKDVLSLLNFLSLKDPKGYSGEGLIEKIFDVYSFLSTKLSDSQIKEGIETVVKNIKFGEMKSTKETVYRFFLLRKELEEYFQGIDLNSKVKFKDDSITIIKSLSRTAYYFQFFSQAKSLKLLDKMLNTKILKVDRLPLPSFIKKCIMDIWLKKDPIF